MPLKKAKPNIWQKNQKKNKKVEKSQKRKPKYSTDEERKYPITKSKTKYMMNKKWCCNVCNDYNYTLAGKHCHLKSMKHIRNATENNV